jgi:hypothetical protein
MRIITQPWTSFFSNLVNNIVNEIMLHQMGLWSSGMTSS